MGDDTGISSVAICATMTGSRHGRVGSCRPHDPSDFGRCYRLLARFPEWRGRMPEVAARFPEWGPLVAIWDELTIMYEAILATKAQHGEAHYPYVRNHMRLSKKERAQIAVFEAHPATKAYRAMYDRMQQVEDSCMVAGGWTKTGPGSWTKGATT
jgi:hypothetical protein